MKCLEGNVLEVAQELDPSRKKNSGEPRMMLCASATKTKGGPNKELKFENEKKETKT